MPKPDKPVNPKCPFIAEVNGLANYKLTARIDFKGVAYKWGNGGARNDGRTPSIGSRLPTHVSADRTLRQREWETQRNSRRVSLSAHRPQGHLFMVDDPR